MEVESKLMDLGMIPEARAEILHHLIKFDFLNEERFALTYARSKFNQKHWGKVRLKNELKRRQISSYLITKALAQFSNAEYADKLDEIASKKWSQIKGPSLQHKKKKLFDYLVYRGWEYALVYDKIREFASDKK